ncbi:MAG TPA: hypothetical protein ENK55_09890 [Actinobacteria bacterium]|nr:hypothetical protein [Actinomycetota bacterium]
MSSELLWQVALGIGLVVAAVVWLLLHLLYRQVVRIDDGLALIWQRGKELAANTATTWMLGQTARLLDELRQEVFRHDEAFGSPR